MDEKLYGIIKEAHDKYGKEHKITVHAAKILSRFIKSAKDYPEIDGILEQSLDVDLDELESLFNPDHFEFERQEVGQVEVEK